MKAIWLKVKWFWNNPKKTILVILGIGVAYAAIPDAPVQPIENQPTYFAEIAPDGIVLRVIVISPEILATGRWGDRNNWVQTYIEENPTKNARKNYAGIGYKFDATRNAFIPPKSSDTAILDESTARWAEPITEKVIKNETASTTI